MRDVVERLEEGDSYAIGAARREIKRLRAENERLQAIVDRLPVTADGVPIVFGMTVWMNTPNAGIVQADTGLPNGGIRVGGIVMPTNIRPEICYSTREAAEAARDAKWASS